MALATLLKRLTAQVLAATLIMTGMNAQATAGMIGTTTLAQSEQTQVTRDRLQTLLDRTDVQERLVGLGVDPDAAAKRIAALTDAEIAALADRMEEMPAGGTDLLGAALLVFIILLITDIVGWTNIFPFVKGSR
jgi:hypothetical protein